MTLLILSFFAGVLTVAAPCILPLLPVIVGGSLVDGEDKKKAWLRPVVVTSSLAVSVIVFSLLLKATTSLLGVPQGIWNSISGIIVILLGLYLLFPIVWEKLMVKTGFNLKSNELLNASYRKQGLLRDVLMGASLGPVFSSCSPTYALIVAVILPVSLIEGLVYLVAYALGLASVLLVIAMAGQSAVRKMGWLSNPHGWFRKSIGILFILVGVAVLFGLDRDFQAYVLEKGWYDPIMRIEDGLGLDKVK